MPKKVVPTSYTAGRDIRLSGTVYTKGQTIPNATVKAQKALSRLLSRRFIIPDKDPHGRKTKLRTPTPTDVNPSFRKAL
jgi:hypothetical protein